MRIKDICQTCNLTKKAVECYEKHGLIRPNVLENGYRDYSDEDVVRLKEISVLRHCGIGISDIHAILNSENKAAALARYRHLTTMRMERVEAEQLLMAELMREYDVERIFESAFLTNDCTYTMKEKLLMAFPGNYGIWISLHFGRFLDSAIETEEQQAAYRNIVAYLDDVPAVIPDELAQFMQSVFDEVSYDEMIKLEHASDEAFSAVIADPETYLRENNVEEYLQYRLSDEFRASPAGRMAELMVQFQNSSGYRDIFIANLQKLSPAYCNYLSELVRANAAFLEKYPEAKNMYNEAN